jgi:hypothetical protein
MVVGDGAPTLTVQPAMQTAAMRSTATSKSNFFPIIIVTAYFFIQIIVMDLPVNLIKNPEYALRIPEKSIFKKISAFLIL